MEIIQYSHYQKLTSQPQHFLAYDEPAVSTPASLMIERCKENIYRLSDYQIINLDKTIASSTLVKYNSVLRICIFYFYYLIFILYYNV